MEPEKIKELLAKYWACESTLEEEKELKNYFSSGNVDPQFEKEATLFNHLVEEANTEVLEESFDNEVMEKIGDNFKAAPKGRVISMFNYAARIAAVGLILVTAGYFIKEEMNDEDIQPQLTDTFEDPKKAFEETKKALQLISKNFNKGREQARKISTFNEATEKVKDNNL